MPRKTFSPPKYRHYRPKNLAVVRIAGRDYYLGPYGSQESRDEYLRLLAEFSLPSPAATPDQSVPPIRVGLTIDELVNEYRKFAVQYYRDGAKPGKEYLEMRYAARPLRRLYGGARAADFGPLKLKAIQRHLVEEKKLCRAVINRRVNRIRRIFKWAVSEELVPPSVHQGLQTVPPLLKNRTTAREKPPVAAVAWEVVEPTLSEVSRQVAAMIRLQWLTGMRPYEVVAMRPCDIDRKASSALHRGSRLVSRA